MALINDAGKLNSRCTFYSMVEEETPRGTIKRVPQKEFSCWCTVRQARLREIQEALGTGYNLKTTIIIRHQQRKEIKNDWTVEIRGQKYEIISYVPDFETKQYDMLVLEAKS